MSKFRIKNPVTGHVCGTAAVLLWGIAFASSVHCMKYMAPSQLTCFGFVLAYFILVLIYPRFKKPDKFKDEVKNFFTGIVGMLGFRFLSDYALYTGDYATSTIVLALSPILSLVILCVTGRKNRLKFLHLAGFIVGGIGTVLVAVNGTGSFTLSLDMWPTLALAGACLCFAVYTVIMDGYSGQYIIAHTRRSVFWAMLASIPLMIFTDGFPDDVFDMLRLSVVVCLILAGTFGIGFGYVLWYNALSCIGTDCLVSYFYMIPSAALAFTVFALRSGEFSMMAVAGTVLCAAGVIVSAIAG